MYLTTPRKINILHALLWLSLCLPTCAAGQDTQMLPLSEDSILYEIYFTGQTDLDRHFSPVVSEMLETFSKSKHNKTCVFTGNSVSSTFDPEDQMFSGKLKTSLQQIKKVTKKNEVYFLPGNEEWFDGNTYAVKALRDNEDFIQDVFDDNVFLPGKGCGEPKVKVLSDMLAIVFIDSQWLIQGDDSDERKRSGCEVDNTAEFIVQLQDIIKDHRKKHIIIAAHHPLQSNGFVGGHYTLMDHLFPFRSFSKAMMIPLPIIGSFMTGIKKTIGFDQQVHNPRYQGYVAAIETATRNFSNITIIHAHENNLQVFREGSNSFITAGGGSDSDYAMKSGRSEFVLGKPGFGVIRLYDKSGLHLELFVAGHSEPVYSELLAGPIVHIPEDTNEIIDSQDLPPRMVVKGSDIYNRNWLGRFLFGKNYRDVWSAEIEVPVLLLDTVSGGLVPVKQGGGFQTRSLRLENSMGEQFVLRSINKDVTAVVPPALRNTLAQSLIQDGISASHPYAAFIVPDLADAAGVFHTNPKPVYLPEQAALGVYNDKFKNQLYLFEERTGGRTEAVKSFGYSKKLIGSPELIETIHDKYKHSVDQESFLRARLFDLWLGDWDRHQDQWRWALFKEGDKTIYKPVPRDRDQVFFRNDGPLNYLVSRPFFTPGLRKFGDEIDILRGLAFNARYVDRAFLNALSEEDFVNMAEDLQFRLTDDIIESALKKWPEEIYQVGGNDIVGSLKKRRDDLPNYAKEHHRYLSRIVSVTGTTEENRFTVDRLENNKTRISVWEVNKKREVKGQIFERLVDNEVTREIRLYGLKGDDEFYLGGSGQSGPLVRIIGGGGDDVVIDSTAARGSKILVYDKPRGMHTESLNNKLKSRKSAERGINHYNFNEWKMDAAFHYPFVAFISDEGLKLSYNILWRKHGFRKTPFKSKHSLSLGFATGTSGLFGHYSGYFTDVGGSMDLSLDGELFMPTYVQQFYGLTNAYINVFPDVKRSYYFVEGSKFLLEPKLIKNIKNQSSFRFGPILRYMDINTNDEEERFIEDPIASGFDFDGFSSSYYTGLDVSFVTHLVNRAIDPTRGYRISLSGQYLVDVTETDYSNLTLEGQLVTYIPFDQNELIVWANNLGASHILGDFEFFDARYLAQPNRMRGFRLYRFGGRSLFYNASDLRINIASIKNVSIPTNFGVHVSFDTGRVWNKGDIANNWHYSYGGGIIFKLLETFIFRISYFKGNEDSQLSIGGNYSF